VPAKAPVGPGGIKNWKNRIESVEHTGEGPRLFAGIEGDTTFKILLETST